MKAHEVEPARRPLREELARRLMVPGPGLLLGAVFSLWVAGPMMPSWMGASDRALVWAYVMSGPAAGTAWGMVDFHPSVGLGWLGLALALAHPLRPLPATGVVTALGLAVWFFSGFVAVMVAVWGA
jgi:hypothetical protein